MEAVIFIPIVMVLVAWLIFSKNDRKEISTAMADTITSVAKTAGHSAKMAEETVKSNRAIALVESRGEILEAKGKMTAEELKEAEELINSLLSGEYNEKV